jgi:hypothetical protein
MTELDAASRVALVAGAATVAGPGASPSVIEATVVDLALMADPDSLIMKRLVRIQGAQRFVAELVDVTIEQSSTRALLKLKTDDVTDKKPDGIESMRTERTDQPDGISMYRRALGLKDHRVLVFKEVQPTADPNKKVRICLHLIDLGMPDEKPEIDPSREQAVNVRVVADANGEKVASYPDAGTGGRQAEAEAQADYARSSAGPLNFLPYWSKEASTKGWAIHEMISALQRTPEGAHVTSVKSLDPNSDLGIALQVMVDRGKDRAGV